MARQMPSDCRPIDAINPADGSVFQLYVRVSKMKQTASRGKGAAKELGYTVPYACMHLTCGIYRGIREDGEIDGLCYVSKPLTYYHPRSGLEFPPEISTLFLVFVNDDGIIYMWRWEDADPNNDDMPANVESRFTERLL